MSKWTIVLIFLASFLLVSAPVRASIIDTLRSLFLPSVELSIYPTDTIQAEEKVVLESFSIENQILNFDKSEYELGYVIRWKTPYSWSCTAETEYFGWFIGRMVLIDGEEVSRNKHFVSICGSKPTITTEEILDTSGLNLTIGKHELEVWILTSGICYNYEMIGWQNYLDYFEDKDCKLRYEKFGAIFDGFKSGNPIVFDSRFSAWKVGGDFVVCKGGKCVLEVPVLKLGENQLLVIESFSGGSTISRYSTRYPVVQFSYVTPAIVVDATDNSVFTSMEIYEKLDNGETIQVPLDQVYTLFYVIENNYQLPTVCDVVDVDTGQCAKINPGITYACSEGQFDPSLGLCVIQPESKTICPEGGRYDVAQAVCIWNPPLQAVCPDGAIYDVNTQLCKYTPEEVWVCELGYTYNENTNKCEIYPEKTIVCPGGYAYDVNLDQCVQYPDERIICPTDSSFNAATGYCEYLPQSEWVCSVNFVYNPATELCEYYPPADIICTYGTYDKSLGKCVVSPPTDHVCSKGILSEDKTMCIYSPEAVAECLQGTYDENRNACVYEPDLQYLCINGELAEDRKSCVITPEAKIVCFKGFSYNAETDLCEKYPDYWEYRFSLTETLKNYWWVFVIIGLVSLILYKRRK